MCVYVCAGSRCGEMVVSNLTATSAGLLVDSTIWSHTQAERPK